MHARKCGTAVGSQVAKSPCPRAACCQEHEGEFKTSVECTTSSTEDTMRVDESDVQKMETD